MICCGKKHELLPYHQATQEEGEIWVANNGECWVCPE